MDLAVLYDAACFSSFGFQLFETFNIPIKPLKLTTNSTDEPKDTHLTTMITVIWLCKSGRAATYLRITSIYNVPTLHNLRRMPTFSANAGDTVPVYSKTECNGVEVVVVARLTKVCVTLQTCNNVFFPPVHTNHVSHRECVPSSSTFSYLLLSTTAHQRITVRGSTSRQTLWTCT